MKRAQQSSPILQEPAVLAFTAAFNGDEVQNLAVSALCTRSTPAASLVLAGQAAGAAHPNVQAATKLLELLILSLMELLNVHSRNLPTNCTRN